jgi:hypothetical protein
VFMFCLVFVVPQIPTNKLVSCLLGIDASFHG